MCGGGGGGGGGGERPLHKIYQTERGKRRGKRDRRAKINRGSHKDRPPRNKLYNDKRATKTRVRVGGGGGGGGE